VNRTWEGGTTATAGGEPDLIVLPSPEETAREAAARITEALAAAVADRGRADWATTGGSTPTGIYRGLGEPRLRGAVPWDAVQLWWGDDRYVPRDHPFSNVRIADQLLLGGTRYADGAGEMGSIADPHPEHRPAGVPIPLENVHAFPTGEAIGEGQDAAWCATRYIAELRASGIRVEDGWPAFDVMMVGIGPDGHLLSVFPGSVAFDTTDWALAVPAPTHVEPHVERVTLNPRVLDVAGLVLAVVQGEAKAGIVAEIFGSERDPRRWPAQLARRAGAVWLLDEAAAARLPAAARAGAAPAP
jgi:6-phosphogluconolactonase